MAVPDSNLIPRVILVADDERCVLSCVCYTLERAGFRVLRAGSAEEALRLGKEWQDAIDLLLADVIMPGQSGPTLAGELKRLHPETQCLFMAGLPDNPEVVDRVLAAGHPFLPKPFVPQVLIEKVREVLFGAPPETAAAVA